jgi:hypothetical protein
MNVVHVGMTLLPLESDVICSGPGLVKLGNISTLFRFLLDLLLLNTTVTCIYIYGSPKQITVTLCNVVLFKQFIPTDLDQCGKTLGILCL